MNFVKNGLNFKLKHRNAQKSILSGRFDEKLGDSRQNRESWQVCICFQIMSSFRSFLLKDSPCGSHTTKTYPSLFDSLPTMYFLYLPNNLKS